MLELLQTHARMSGSELAQRLEVDVRTVRRYIAALEELGIPITTERGRFGAYLLVAGFKLPPMMFTDDEALALSVGLQAARRMGLPEAGVAIESAQAKLERVMPAKLKRRVRAVGEMVSIDLSRGSPRQSNAGLLALSTAAHAQQRVHLHYRSNDGAGTERDFDPYGLAWRTGQWYVIGMCHLRKGMRSFRIDRVHDVQPLQESFSRPADFDALNYLAASIATIDRAVAVEVLLKTDLRTAREAIRGDIGLLEPQHDGVLLRSRTDDVTWYGRQLARLPFDFEIRSPPELREALRTHAAHLLALLPSLQ
jgi:predicted DNA-binding transcriptional regulator YafY